MNASLDQYHHVHFVGIGGSGMSALARWFVGSGYQVSGSDRAPRERTRDLADLGVLIYTDHAPDNVDGADLVVISAAIPASNPEVQAARNGGIPVVKRAELLGVLMNAGHGIAVAGTHGKTTTSALIGHVLCEAGCDPTILIGGVSSNLGSNARVGKSNLIVGEADEYDASFLQLHPYLGVVTNITPEHLDFYRTVDNMHRAFQLFMQGVSDTLVIAAEDPVLVDLSKGAPARIVTYGIENGEWQASDIRDESGQTVFTVRHGDWTSPCTIQLAGRHNVLNTLAAFAVSSSLDVPPEKVVKAVASFQGVRRRFEIKGTGNNVLVVDDYAVHPVEIRATLMAMKDRLRRPLRVVFQPHTYSRTRAFLDDFALSFDAADYVYVLDVYAARETDTLGVSGEDLAFAMRATHPCACYVPSQEAALQQLLHDVRPGDAVVTMGAGDVYQLGEQLLQAVRRQ